MKLALPLDLHPSCLLPNSLTTDERWSAWFVIDTGPPDRHLTHCICATTWTLFCISASPKLLAPRQKVPESALNQQPVSGDGGHALTYKGIHLRYDLLNAFSRRLFDELPVSQAVSKRFGELLYVACLSSGVLLDREWETQPAIDQLTEGAVNQMELT